ncbi:MAG TPA: multidrug efflux RND transporter permease subunit [Candidatus Tectomicrobia bacterium]|nr:multidrug efflux RND transporter permease subunit [Candidatus Tectomicrobia bacterium]
MNISALFIHRPVGTTLLTIALALAGAVAYQLLPVSPLPQVDFPTVEVTAALPGASPETMASAVTTPLERHLGRIAGLNEMTSVSTLGQTRITLQFDLSRNINAAARDVQAAINAASGQLPPTLPNAPRFRKTNPADLSIIALGLTSDILDRGQLYDVASSILEQKLSQVEGVGLVSIGGGALPAVRVQVNPTVLQSYGLSLDDVRAVLGSANANRPKGEIADGSRAWSLSATDQLLKAEEYRPLIISHQDGRAVRLSDVAIVSHSVQDIRNMGLINGKPGILVFVRRQPGANIIDTVDRVRALLPQLRAEIPPTIDLTVALDRTTTIRASVHEVQFTLVLSIVLVILVVLFFLRNVRTAIIPSVAVPVSLISTFGVMYLLGYSLNNLTLMALTIATGFVVDDAIVVIENIMRYLERGMRPLEAALRGAKEIGFTVVSITASLLAVFIPILMMGGLFGRVFREFAVSLAVAVAVSLVVSLTTTPMMCARLLRAQADERRGLFYRLSEGLFLWFLRRYETTLAWVLRHQPLMLLVTLATIGSSIYLYVVIPKGFFPQQDTGTIFGSITADQSSSFQAMRERLEQYAKIVGEDPAVASVMAFTGGFAGATNVGRMFVMLKPLEERQISADQVVARLRPKVARVTGARIGMQVPQDLRMGGRLSSAQYQFTLQGDDVRELNEWGPQVLNKLQTLPELTDVSSDQQDKGLEAMLVIDRDTASRLGISPAIIDETLYSAFGQRQVSTMYRSLNQYRVVLEVEPRFWQDPDGLKYVYVKGANDTLVPLSAFTHYAPSNTALTINHQGQFPAVTMSFNLTPGVALGDAVLKVERAMREMGVPSSIRGSFQGIAQAFQDSLTSQPFLIAAALVTVYIVLGILYESVIHPLTILSTLPSAGVGALLALLICSWFPSTGITDLNIIALIGIILLIGIVKKNAIMMIDFALEAERSQGKRPVEAIFQACLLRFRPITMTTMAAMLGALPLALGTGIGSELRRPLGVTIVGGLLLSQLITLYTTPVVYLYLDRLRDWCARLRHGSKRADRLEASEKGAGIVA